MSENQPVRSTEYHRRSLAGRLRELEQFGGGELRQLQLASDTLKPRGVDDAAPISFDGETNNLKLEIQRSTV